MSQVSAAPPNIYGCVGIRMCIISKNSTKGSCYLFWLLFWRSTHFCNLFICKSTWRSGIVSSLFTHRWRVRILVAPFFHFFFFFYIQMFFYATVNIITGVGLRFSRHSPDWQKIFTRQIREKLAKIMSLLRICTVCTLSVLCLLEK
jgi:hypothetical protein